MAAAAWHAVYKAQCMHLRMCLLLFACALSCAYVYGGCICFFISSSAVFVFLLLISHLLFSFFFFSFLQPSVARLIDTSVIQEALKPGHFQVVIWACRRSPAVQFYRERTAQRLPVVYPYYPSIYAYAEQRDELYRLLMLGVEAHISAPPPDRPFMFNQAFVFKR